MSVLFEVRKVCAYAAGDFVYQFALVAYPNVIESPIQSGAAFFWGGGLLVVRYCPRIPVLAFAPVSK